KGATKSKKALVSKERFHITHFTNPSGETVFRLGGYKPDGSRVRENWKTEEEAVGRKAELDIEAANIVSNIGTRLKATRLTDDQVKEAERAFAKLADKFPDKSPMEAIEFFCKNYREPVRQVAVEDAIKQFIADRKRQNRRPDTL